MDGYSVDVDELRRTAGAMYKLGSNFSRNPTLGYYAAETEVGHDDLATALGELRQASQRITKDLCVVSEEAATRLRGNASTYEEGDKASADAIASAGRELGAG